MFKNARLGAALTISISIHFLALSSWDIFDFSNFMSKRDAKPEIEITYFVKKIADEKVASSLPKKYDVEEKMMTAKRQVIAPKEKAPEAAKPEKREVPVNEDLQNIDSDKLEDYISYYKLLRERIKKKVSSFYADSSIQGVAYVVFRLNRYGILTKVDVDELKSSEIEYLKETALKSVRAASPLPPFPDTINKEELIFSLAIIFKKE
ncbi:MAG: TonB C-terminal domain-containing protein [Candidatus Omnitrophota bacterium]